MGTIGHLNNAQMYFYEMPESVLVAFVSRVGDTLDGGVYSAKPHTDEGRLICEIINKMKETGCEIQDGDTYDFVDFTRKLASDILSADAGDTVS